MSSITTNTLRVLTENNPIMFHSLEDLNFLDRLIVIDERISSYVRDNKIFVKDITDDANDPILKLFGEYRTECLNIIMSGKAKL